VIFANEIGDFGGLVGFLLALATLLTANRANALADLEKAPDFDRRDKVREVLLDSGLAVITALVFLAGVPLAIRAARGLHPLAHGGPLRSVFILTWALLVALIAWQSSVAWRASKLTVPP
jgi:hypothetical protein